MRFVRQLRLKDQEPLPGIVAVGEETVDSAKEHLCQPLLLAPSFDPVQEKHDLRLPTAHQRQDAKKVQMPETDKRSSPPTKSYLGKQLPTTPAGEAPCLSHTNISLIGIAMYDNGSRLILGTSVFGNRLPRNAAAFLNPARAMAQS
jgi:hypothetical protein